MTREEASEVITIIRGEVHPAVQKEWEQMAADVCIEALDLAIAALKGPTREQVERMRGAWARTYSTDNFWTEVWKCSYCGFEDDNGDCFDFCPECGQPKTEEAVDMVMERLEEVQNDQ